MTNPCAGYFGVTVDVLVVVVLDPDDVEVDAVDAVDAVDPVDAVEVVSVWVVCLYKSDLFLMAKAQTNKVKRRITLKFICICVEV